MIEITFGDKELENLFNNWKLMSKKIGDKMTRAIKKRYDQLLAYNNVGLLLSHGLGKPEILKDDFAGHISLHINTGNYRLILYIYDFENIKSDMNKINISECLIVKGVYDYHGSKKERKL